MIVHGSPSLLEALPGPPGQPSHRIEGEPPPQDRDIRSSLPQQEARFTLGVIFTVMAGRCQSCLRTGVRHVPALNTCPGHRPRHSAAMIGVGRGAASLRTGLADLPHPALQSVVLPTRGLANRIISVLQAEQPMFGKDGILAASAHLFEGRQHPCRPDGWFGPGVKLPRLSCSFTRRLRPRDCHRCSSVRSRHHVSTFLHPPRVRPLAGPRACFCPPALPGFGATMSALTSARGCACGLLNLAHIPCSLPRRSLHVTGITFRGLRVQSPHRLLRSLCHLSCQRRRLPAHRGSGLRLSIGGSPVGTAESSSCHYGLPVRLPLLPTPPRDDAVTVGYRTETGIPEGDLHLSDVACLWTHALFTLQTAHASARHSR